MRTLNRRRLIETLLATGALPLLPGVSRAAPGIDAAVFPTFLVTLTAHGAWDVASFCDPKANVAGMPIINNWAKSAEIQTAGNIPYAPFAANANFFNAHFGKMLVINGINARTNAHDVGRLVALTGSAKDGAPSLGALYATAHRGTLAMPLLVGSSFETGGLLAPTQVADGLDQLIALNKASTGSYLPDEDLDLITRHQQERLTQQKRQGARWDAYQAAVNTDSSRFPLLVEYLQKLEWGPFPVFPELKAVRYALCAFKAGLSVAFDHNVFGFDAHDNHDARMAGTLEKLTTVASAMWFYADQLGITDQLMVVISSDFARTPYYNAVGGKDHWPYGSLVVMKTGVPWTNRVIGVTSPGLIGSPLGPATLTNSNLGVELESRFIQGSLRRYLGIDKTPAALAFKLKEELVYDFFRVPGAA